MDIETLADAEPEEMDGDIQESTALLRRGIVGDVGEQVVSVSEVTFRPGERTRLHEHTYGQVLYVTRGTGVVATADEERTVETGDLVFVSPGEVHWHGTAREDPVEFAHLTYVLHDELGADTVPVGDVPERTGE